eukprot:307800_1
MKDHDNENINEPNQNVRHSARNKSGPKAPKLSESNIKALEKYQDKTREKTGFYPSLKKWRQQLIRRLRNENQTSMINRMNRNNKTGNKYMIRLFLDKNNLCYRKR